jgi:hypothetical protein
MAVGNRYFARSVGRFKRCVGQGVLPMHIVTTIKTSHGPRLLLLPPPMIRISVTPSELHALILVIERDAAEAERELRFSAADHLARRALALRRAIR